MTDKNFADIYSKLFNYGPSNSKSKGLIGTILGEEAAGFYDRYFRECNSIILKLMEDDGIVQKVQPRIYYEYASKLFLFLFHEEKGSENKNVVENFLKVLSILSNNNDPNELFDMLIGMMYENYYK